MSIFINNIKIINPKSTRVIRKNEIKLNNIFDIMDMRPISFYLNLNIKPNYENKIIKLFYLAYIQKVLIKYFFQKINSINTIIEETVLKLGPNLSTKAI